ncbi:MAG: hypothetical protein AAB295_01180, partial [Chloroflexota bacterium]
MLRHLKSENEVDTGRIDHLKVDGGTGSLRGARLRPEHLGALVKLVKAGAISATAAKDVFAEIWATGAEPMAVVKAKGLAQVSDESAIAAAVDAVLAENPKAVSDYQAGNQRALGALVGQV